MDACSQRCPIRRCAELRCERENCRRGREKAARSRPVDGVQVLRAGGDDGDGNGLGWQVGRGQSW